MQTLHADGQIALHTRSRKYGKLERGQLVRVQSALIKRLKHHFETLAAFDVDIILGCNGFVWVQERSPKPATEDDEMEDLQLGTEASWRRRSALEPVGAPPRLRPGARAAPGCCASGPCGLRPERRGAVAGPEAREKICRVANAVRVLASLSLTIHPAARPHPVSFMFRAKCSSIAKTPSPGCGHWHCVVLPAMTDLRGHPGYCGRRRG